VTAVKNPSGDQNVGRTPDLTATRWSLIERLKDWDDDKSWKEFFDTYAQLIYGVALKAGLSRVEAQEVVQETVIAVAKRMPRFECDAEAGSFKGFLLKITGRRITDQFRKRAKEGPAGSSTPAMFSKRSGVGQEDDDRTATIDRIPDPGEQALEAVWDAEWRAHLTTMATARLRKLVDPGQYQMFELYVLNGQPVREVARKLGVTMAQVYFAKYRVSKLLKREVKILQEALS